MLCLNHEAITEGCLHPAGQTIVSDARTVADEVLTEMNAHGVSVIEVAKSGNNVTYRKDSAFNRRITALTDMALSGPVAKSPLMITAYSKDGSTTRGTVSNCANGYIPWGTYLICEENWAGFFRRIAATDDANRSSKEKASFARYDVSGKGTHLRTTAAVADAADKTPSPIMQMRPASAVTGRTAVPPVHVRRRIGISRFIGRCRRLLPGEEPIQARDADSGF